MFEIIHKDKEIINSFFPIGVCCIRYCFYDNLNIKNKIENMKIYCNVCEKNISFSYYEKHIQTNKHKQKETDRISSIDNSRNISKICENCNKRFNVSKKYIYCKLCFNCNRKKSVINTECMIIDE